jgi:hypothetical protein
VKKPTKPKKPKRIHRNKVQLCLWVTPEQDAQLRILSDAMELPVSAVVRLALEKLIEEAP